MRVEAAWRAEPQRRAFVHLDSEGERTITTTGARLVPHGADASPWSEVEGADAAYVTAADAGGVRAARAAERLVATVRAGEALAASGVELDVLVMSANDSAERYASGEFEPAPLAVVRTNGRAGGSFETADGATSHWAAPQALGPVVDSYGAGDSFAGGLTFGLGQGRSLAQSLALGARCGAANITGRSPYEGQLTAVDVP